MLHAALWLHLRERFLIKCLDKKSVWRDSQVGNKVLALLSISSSALQAKFCGPYMIEEKLSETDYVVGTPDRRRETRVCHMNMLKPYFTRSDIVASPSVLPPTVATVTSVTAALPIYSCESDGLCVKSSGLSSRLQNSEILENLPAHLQHLDASAQADIINLVENNSTLFSDTPSRPHHYFLSRHRCW